MSDVDTMPTITRFQRVIEILDAAIGGPSVSIRAHGAFWRGLTRDQFVARSVFGQALIVVGAGADSNLVRAFKGEAPFGSDLPTPPAGAVFSRMPAGLPPVSDEDIAFIEQWIDDGSPEDPLPSPGPALTWRRTNAPDASSRTDDIWFETPSLGWAVNSNGQILRTTDGGDTWDEQFHDPADPPIYLRCVGFASQTRGWVGTLSTARRLFETHDGGANWSLVPDLPALAPSAVCGLTVVNESVVYASGTNFPNRPARMMKTVDGGATWTAWDMSAHATLLVDTYFASPECGWVVGGQVQSATDPLTRANVKAVVLRTEDGGQTWVNRVADLTAELPLGEWGWKIQFLNDLVGFVSLESFTVGAILKTMDGGQTWERLEVNDPQRNANLEGIGFVGPDHGWVGGWGSASFEEGYSSETEDGGLNWDNANEIGQYINRFRFFGDPVTVGYSSGLTVYKYSAEPVPIAALEARPPTMRYLDSNEPADAARPVRIPIAVPEGASRLVVNIWGRFGDHLGTLMDEPRPAPGDRVVEWDVTDDAGEPLDPGSIILRVTVDDRSESRILRIAP
ncbi:MAG: WD40/YVTN/BNR-like repeat-containing protein [Egibacteraceae bacterium]